MSQFYAGVYEVVDDPSLDSIISWSKSNKSFVIWDPKELVEKILSRFFRNKLSQFISDLESHVSLFLICSHRVFGVLISEFLVGWLVGW